jgi:hypothetical protein
MKRIFINQKESGFYGSQKVLRDYKRRFYEECKKKDQVKNVDVLWEFAKICNFSSILTVDPVSAVESSLEVCLKHNVIRQPY